MTDPTAVVLTCCFSVAIGVFVIAAIFQLLRRPAPVADLLPPPLPTMGTATDGDPYPPPAHVLLAPPPLPQGKVPTWFFRPADFAWMGIICLLFFVFGYSESQGAGEATPEINPQVLIFSMGIQFFLAGITVFVVATRVKASTWLGLRWRQWPWIFLIAPVSVFLFYAFMSLLQMAGFMDWVQSLGGQSTQETVKLLQTADDPVVLILMGVAAVIVAPICEEIVFRGYLYAAAKRFTGPGVAGFCSGLVFAAAHGNLMAILPLFLLGWFLAVLYERTGSIWAPMAVHFCFNGSTVLVQTLVRVFNIPLDS